MYVKENKRNNEMKQEKEKRNGKKEKKKKIRFLPASIRDLIVDVHIALVICVDESFFRINVNTCGYEMLEMHNQPDNDDYFWNF